MDHTTLIALASWNANLKGTRIHRIDAWLQASGVPEGGVLNNETTVALSSSVRPNEWVSTVGLKIVGYPKGTTPENAEQTKPAFHIEAVVKGVYTWLTAPEKSVLADAGLAHALGRQIYAVAVCECQAAAGKMGLHGIKIPADLARSGGKEVSVSEDDLHRLQLEAPKAVKQVPRSRKKLVSVPPSNKKK